MPRVNWGIPVEGLVVPRRDNLVLFGGPPELLARFRAHLAALAFRGSCSREVQRMLTDIYLVQDLHIPALAVSAGGYTGLDFIVVSVQHNGGVPGYAHTLAQLHSEFSSNLVRQYGFPFDEWQAASPTVEYGSVSREGYLRARGTTAIDFRLAFLTGVLNGYGLTHIENDINLYVFHIHARDEGFRELVGSNHMVAAKVRLLLDFYQWVGCPLPPLEEGVETVWP